MSPNSNAWLVIVLSSLLLLLELFVVFKLYLKLIRLVFRQRTWSDLPVPLWITTLALAATFFPATFSGLLIKPVQFIASELYRHSVAVKQVLTGGKDASKGQDVYALFEGIFMSLREFISSYNALYILLFVALCILLSLGFKKNFKDRTGAYSTAHLAGNYKKVAVLIFFILGSLYIIFTSLVGLTYIQKNKMATDITGEGVDSLFDPTGRSEIDATAVLFDSIPVTQKLAALRECLDNVKALDTLGYRPGHDSVHSLVKLMENNLTNYKNFSDILLDDWRKLTGKREKLKNDLANKREELKSKLVIYKGSLSNYLLQTYAGQLRNWYNSAASNSFEYYKSLKGEFELVENSILFFGDDLLRAFNSSYEQLKNGRYSEYMVTKSIAPNSVYFEMNKYDADLKKNDLDMYTYIPDPPTSGNEWGAIGRASQWIMSPNSVDLVLIIGMFGFGLFGAAISTFIREHHSNNTEDPVAEHIAKVLIKGVSAAIVVFLGTKGGIALINNGTNDPNAYILFFTCLVGAVFSDEIWDWAKGKINFNNNGFDPGNRNVPGPPPPVEADIPNPQPPATTENTNPGNL